MGPPRKLKKHDLTEDLKQDFKVGDLVGAKVRGYPVWPGKIESIDTTNPKKTILTVRFFGSGDSATQFSELKHYKDFTGADFKPTSKRQEEALRLIREEYESLQKEGGSKYIDQGISQFDGQVDDEKTKACLDNDDHLTIDEREVEEKPRKRTKRVKLEKDADSEVQLDDGNLQPSESNESSKRKRSRSSKPIDAKIETTRLDHVLTKSKNKSLSVRASSRKALPDTKIEPPSEPKISKEQTISGPINNGISSPNNDLVKDSIDSVPALERSSLIDQTKNDNSLSKSTINHNTRLSLDGDEDENVVQNQTIQKLRKKIDKKIKEKERLKKMRLERKEYERALRKFPFVYKKLDHLTSLSENLKRKKGTNLKHVTKLENAHRNLETTLIKCIKICSTKYGKTQQNSAKFRKTLEAIVVNLKDVRDTVGSNNLSVARVIKRLLRIYKATEIREFINEYNFESGPGDVMNERKENDAIKMK